MRNGRMTITEVARRLGVAPKTITRWEKAGRIQRSKRDWRGWRVYNHADFRILKDFFNSLYEAP